jgi:signal transduction histidine kinase
MSCFSHFERATPAELARQAALFATADLTRLLDFIPDMILILNKERQAVFGNRAARDHFPGGDDTGILGLRLGELVKCRNADLTGSGCGSAPFCKFCGGLNAVVQSIENNVVSEGECHLLVHNGCNEEALDLSIQASPFALNGERFILLALNDIAAEKRRASMERLLLHDIFNVGLALRGFAELLSGETIEGEQRRYLQQRIESLAQRIIDGINDHRQLLAAEFDELVPDITAIESLAFLQSLVENFSREAADDGKILRITAASRSIMMKTDAKLLGQVIGAMIRNALEASLPGEAVTIDCSLQQGMVHIAVANPAFIPEEIRAHLFSRSVSTKSHGKGLGTYRMKYLSEKYLHGTVSVTSDAQNGTTFTAVYPVAT